MTAASRPPDDTPTRLKESDEVFAALDALFGLGGMTDPYFILGNIKSRVEETKLLRAEVSRLREALKQQREAFSVSSTDRERQLAADVSRLQQENALLRRSLDILVKQMADAGV
jgi:3-deoxy-D-manno-octulosonic-acid transferase